ncbi:MAG: substrate-binding domain-containing protein [Aeromicrobium sp.]
MALVVAVSAAMLTACGSDATTTTSSAADVDACKTASADAVEKLRAEPQFALPDTTIKAGIGTGKSVWVANLLSNELVVNITNGIKDAADAAGLEFKELNGTGTTQSSNQMITTALGAGADAIILNGIDPSTVTNPLEQAKAAGVPVITVISGVLDNDNPLIFGDVTPDENKLGTGYADYALFKTDCDLKLGSIALPKAFELNYTLDKDTHAEVERLCPSCTVDTIEMDIANLATALPTQVQSLLKRNPEINYLALGFDAIASYVGSSATRINPDIKMIGNNGLTPNMKDIIDGGVQEADLTYPPNEYVGWLLMDKVLSAFSGGERGNTEIPMRLADETNIGDGDLTKLFPSWDGFESKFTEHWGL